MSCREFVWLYLHKSSYVICETDNNMCGGGAASCSHVRVDFKLWLIMVYCTLCLCACMCMYERMHYTTLSRLWVLMGWLRQRWQTHPILFVMHTGGFQNANKRRAKQEVKWRRSVVGIKMLATLGQKAQEQTLNCIIHSKWWTFQSPTVQHLTLLSKILKWCNIERGVRPLPRERCTRFGRGVLFQFMAKVALGEMLTVIVSAEGESYTHTHTHTHTHSNTQFKSKSLKFPGWTRFNYTVMLLLSFSIPCSFVLHLNVLQH